MKTNKKVTLKRTNLTRLMIVVGVIAVCLVVSFVLTLFMTTGYITSNMMLCMAAGNTLVGTVEDKVEFRGTYRLILNVEGYGSLDYPCTQLEFNRYEISDSVSLSVGVKIA